MTYFGLDLGSKTIGISISVTGIIASVYQTIRFTEDDYQEALAKLLVLIDLEKPQTIILGLPKHMNNDLGIRGTVSLDFKEIIENVRNVKVVLWDERLSTKTARDIMITANLSRDEQKKRKDEIAAVIILQSYLDSLK